DRRLRRARHHGEDARPRSRSDRVSNRQRRVPCARHPWTHGAGRRHRRAVHRRRAARARLRREAGSHGGTIRPRPLCARRRHAVRVMLPDYMVPAVIVPLDALPITPNGKVDRRRLPAPAGERPTLAETYAAPRTKAESILARLWAEVLRLDRVGIHDNFFALG